VYLVVCHRIRRIGRLGQIVRRVDGDRRIQIDRQGPGHGEDDEAQDQDGQPDDEDGLGGRDLAGQTLRGEDIPERLPTNPILIISPKKSR
jgi:hypothetical protein